MSKRSKKRSKRSLVQKKRRKGSNRVYPSELEYDLFKDKPEKERDSFTNFFGPLGTNNKSFRTIGQTSNSSNTRNYKRCQSLRKSMGKMKKNNRMMKLFNRRNEGKYSSRTLGNRKEMSKTQNYLRKTTEFSTNLSNRKNRKNRRKNTLNLNTTNISNKKSTVTLQSRIEFEEKFSLDYSRAFSARKKRHRQISKVKKKN